MMKFILVGLLIFPVAALAEGSCPPGQYPVGGQGAQGCAPIPQAGGASGSPIPAGKWKKTWGAIAIDGDTGNVGPSAGYLTKSQAVDAAVEACKKGGGKTCSSGVFTYKNQCAALAWSSKGGYSVASAKDTPAAEGIAMKGCAKYGGCSVTFSACTKPVFEWY